MNAINLFKTPTSYKHTQHTCTVRPNRNEFRICSRFCVVFGTQQYGTPCRFVARVHKHKQAQETTRHTNTLAGLRRLLAMFHRYNARWSIEKPLQVGVHFVIYYFSFIGPVLWAMITINRMHNARAMHTPHTNIWRIYESYLWCCFGCFAHRWCACDANSRWLFFGIFTSTTRRIYFLCHIKSVQWRW